MRSVDDFCDSWIAERGMTAMPSSRSIVNRVLTLVIGPAPELDDFHGPPSAFSVETVAQHDHIVRHEILNAEAANTAVLLDPLGGRDGGQPQATQARSNSVQFAPDQPAIVELGKERANESRTTRLALTARMAASMRTKSAERS